MRIRKPRRPPTPEENRARNIERIMTPPEPTPRDRIRAWPWAAEEWWCRHVTQRELHRQLDALRITLDRRTAGYEEEGWQRLLSDVGRAGPDAKDDCGPDSNGSDCAPAESEACGPSY